MYKISIYIGGTLGATCPVSYTSESLYSITYNIYLNNFKDNFKEAPESYKVLLKVVDTPKEYKINL